MLKKMIIATIASTAMLAIAGSANAAIGPGLTAAAPAKHITAKIAPLTFKVAGRRRFGHRRHFRQRGNFRNRRGFRHRSNFGIRRNIRHRRNFRHLNHWHFGPYYSCHWLKRKARWTGKRYWWERYRACRYYNYE